MIFDTHAHYDDKAFDEDREVLLKSLPEKGVVGIVNAAADLSSSQLSVKLAEKYPYIYAAVGIHPENLENLGDDYISELEKMVTENKKVVAVGEIGLDYHFRKDNKARQTEVFEAQVQLAKKLDLPVIVHDRDAHGDCLKVLENLRPKGIVHCFSGSLEMAKQVVDLGMYIGVGGVLTFKNAKTLLEVVSQIPLEKMVLETDAPYLAPVPMRGKRCDSSMIKYAAQKIAQLKGLSARRVYEVTLQNALKIFKIKTIGENS